MKKFHLEIVTPDGCAFDGMAESVTVKTDAGEVQILRGHTDLFASVDTGRASVGVDGTKRLAACSGGFLSVKNGDVRLVASTFEFGEDIDLERAKTAKAEAEDRIKTKRNEKDVKLAEAKLKRALTRINVANTK